MKSSTPTQTNPASHDQEVAARLKAAREERDFTQGVVAGRTKFRDPEGKGISRTAIIGYEQGTTRPGLREIRLLCEVLNITPNWLIYGTDSAGIASLPSLEMVSPKIPQLLTVIRTALALATLKGHERDGIMTLVLSLAGRQLGDMGLSSLMSGTYYFQEAIIEALKKECSDIDLSLPLEEIINLLAKNHADLTNKGNLYNFDEDGNITRKRECVYPMPPDVAQFLNINPATGEPLP